MIMFFLGKKYIAKTAILLKLATLTISKQPMGRHELALWNLIKSSLMPIEG